MEEDMEDRDAIVNFGSSCPAFQGHSDDWNWHGSISYLWFPVSDP